MCVIVVKPAGVPLQREILLNCFIRNRDGAGFVYVKDGKLVVQKGFFEFEEFYQAYVDALSNGAGETNMVIHFRIATHGMIDEENCHPFIIEGHNLAFAHNGIIKIQIPRGSKKSDTVHFRDDILMKLPVGFLNYTGIWELISGYIGHSKLAFLDTDGEFFIVNEHMGVWDKGCWFSNTSYKPVVYKTGNQFKKSKSKVTTRSGFDLGWFDDGSGLEESDLPVAEEMDGMLYRFSSGDDAVGWAAVQEELRLEAALKRMEQETQKEKRRDRRMTRQKAKERKAKN